MAKHIDFGKIGEDAAVVFLKSLSHEILLQNFRHGHGEIDIISKDKEELVFVEVKARSSNHFGYPEEAVSEKKKEKIMEAAQAYIEEIQWQGSFRFDVIALTKNGQNFDVYHIKDAFS